MTLFWPILRYATRDGIRDSIPESTRESTRESVRYGARCGFLYAVIAALILPGVMPAPAQAQGVYLCTQPNGVREYRNTGDTRGCRRLDLEPLSQIPGPTLQAKADPAFPRIDSQVQKRRDQDRLQILMDEVRAEEGKLAELRKEYQNGEPERLGSERNYAKYQDRVALMRDEIARSEKNLEALRREIGQLK